MSNNHETRETSHETLKTRIPHPSFLLNVGRSMFDVECLFSIPAPLHLSRDLYKSTIFLQNKANSPSVQDDTTLFSTRTYENLWLKIIPKNKAKQSQFKPNFSPKLALFYYLSSALSPTSGQVFSTLKYTRCLRSSG